MDKSQGSEGRWGQLGTAAMGAEDGQGPLGSPTRGLWSLGWVQSEAGTSRDQPSPEPEAASLLTAQEGPSFLPVLFSWKSLVTGLCGASGTGREDLLPQREDQGDGSVVIPPPAPPRSAEPRRDRPYVPLAPSPAWPPGQEHHKSTAWPPCRTHPQFPGHPHPSLTGDIEQDGPLHHRPACGEFHLTGEPGAVVLGPWGEGEHRREGGPGAQGAGGS